MKGSLENIFQYRIKGILFDFDGTLTQAGLIDFNVIKVEVECPVELPVLEFIEDISDDDKRKAAFAVLEGAEKTAAKNAVPNFGAEDLLLWLRVRGIPMGILTRNTHVNVLSALGNFNAVDESWFACIISRDDSIMPKPHAGGVFLAAEKMGLSPENLLVVGDYHFDVEAGRGAGALTSFITNNSPLEASTGDADFVINLLEELVDVIEMGLPLKGGKLPNHILEKYLGDISIDDPRVLVSPGVGEDTAAIKWNNEDVLLLKSDPVTFISDSAGKYAVMVNANDIAASGGTPQWFLSTFLFPTGSTPSEMVAMIREVDGACREFGIQLCGGHSEVTDAVSRTVVSGMMAGTVKEKNLRKKSHMKNGDCIVMTKGVAVEGTAIIANEFYELLKSSGVDEAMIKGAQSLEKRISIIPEAKIASGNPGVTAMHDVTEGGIATALDEFSTAGGHSFEIDSDKIYIFAETEAFCSVLNIDPMGLIGSGTLLITVLPQQVDTLIEDLSSQGIEAAVIGRVAGFGRGITATSQGEVVPWLVFPADELSRLF